MSSQEQVSYGVLYVATFQERFIVEAAASAKSLKKYCPHISISLCTNIPDSKWIKDEYFDNVIIIEPDSSLGTEWGQGLLSRISSLPLSPYEKTLHVDSDTRFLDGKVLELFDVLEDYEIGMVEDSPSISIGVKAYQGRMFNGGAILYKKCDKIKTLFKEWKSLFQIQLEGYAQDPLPEIKYMSRIKDIFTRRKLMTHDQLALVQLLGPETNTLNLKYKILEEEWNFCRTLEIKNRAEIHMCHGNNLKADFYNRPSDTSKIGSQREFLERCLADLARIKISMEKGDHKGALTIVDNILQSVPKQSITQVPLARERMKQGQFFEAQKHAEKAIAADVDCYSGFVELATSFINQNKIAEAAKVILQCRSRFPKELGILGLAEIVHNEDPSLFSLPEAQPDYTDLVFNSTLEFPPSISDELFNFIQHHKNLAFKIPSNNPPHVYQTRYLDVKADPIIGELNKIIQPLVIKYLNHIANSKHYFSNARPKKIGLECWGGVIGHKGYTFPQQSDNEKSWASGFVFLKAPKKLKDKTTKDKWPKLEFGCPPLDKYHYSYQPEKWSLSAVDSFIFPSHYWHQITENSSLDDCVFFGFDLLRI